MEVPRKISSLNFPPLPTCGVGERGGHFSAAHLSFPLCSIPIQWKLGKSVSGSFSDDALPFMSYRQSVRLLPSPFGSLGNFARSCKYKRQRRKRRRKTSLSLKTRIPRQWGSEAVPSTSFDLLASKVDIAAGYL